MGIFFKLEKIFLAFIVRLSGRLAAEVNRSVENEVIGYYRKRIGQLQEMGREMEYSEFDDDIERSRAFRKDGVNTAIPSVVSGLSLVVSIMALLVSIFACVISVVLFFMAKTT